MVHHFIWLYLNKRYRVENSNIFQRKGCNLHFLLKMQMLQRSEHYYHNAYSSHK
jgi:hypothetical protein